MESRPITCLYRHAPLETTIEQEEASLVQFSRTYRNNTKAYQDRLADQKACGSRGGV